MYDYFMNFDEYINTLSVKQKISQLFITGFTGNNPKKCNAFKELLKNGLGGVIFFTQNITSEKQFKNIIEEIKSEALIPPFLSIDQEGGRVERTENIHGGKKYLSAKLIAQKGEEALKNQTSEMAKEIQGYGINMNFAPVLDVNTNKNNPVIGDRAYSNDPDEVSKFSKIVIEEYLNKSILPVGKHFPGHGDSGVDSHVSLPTINLPMDELEKKHIKSFRKAIKNNIPAIMIAHVYYPAFDKDKIPASLSQNIITDYLVKKLDFQGIIISDDMVMGAIKGFSPIEACIKALNAGINMFIFRNTDDKVIKLINQLEEAVSKKQLDEKIIDASLKKIFKFKKIHIV